MLLTFFYLNNLEYEIILYVNGMIRTLLGCTTSQGLQSIDVYFIALATNKAFRVQ